MLKIGAVPYINALPLCRYLSLPVVYETPAELEKKMEEGKLDVALLPSVSFLKNKDYQPLFEAGAIQSRGPVKSVILLTKKKLDDPSQIQSIKFSSESRTSVNLFKVIYSLYWGQNLSNLREKEKDPDAILYIGDKAFFVSDPGHKKLDLGEVWHSWTGLPFVYAFWVSRKKIPQETIDLFIKAKKEGLEKIEEIISSVTDLPPDDAKRYLTQSIQYEMSEKSFRGLELFQEYCHQVGLLEEKRSIVGANLVFARNVETRDLASLQEKNCPSIYKKISSGERISPSEALTLAQKADILTLGELARERAIQKNKARAAYLIDRNINYTNICTARCKFCAFYRPHKHKEGYDLSFDEIDKKISETIALGSNRILLQGGLHPDHTIDTYVRLVNHIKKNYPVHIHAFSPVEIHYVADKAKISYDEVIKKLKSAGLGSIPGGGAEILVNRIRNKLSIGKCNTKQWLDASETAHRNGIRTTATMMMGHIENWEDRIEHLDVLRSLQDKTGGFLSFIPWTFQAENTALYAQIKRNGSVKLAQPYEYLRLLAISRLYLDNFDHIQASLLTQGTKVAQMALHFGADDLGSLLIEENVVRLAGCDQEVGAIHELPVQKQKMIRLIKEAGLEPYERDTFYNNIVTRDS